MYLQHQLNYRLDKLLTTGVQFLRMRKLKLVLRYLRRNKTKVAQATEHEMREVARLGQNLVVMELR